MTTDQTATRAPAGPRDFFAGIEPAQRRRLDTLDLHTAPGDTRPRPAIVFVHGGPIRRDHSPRGSGTFIGYGSLAAAHGLVGVTFDHPLHADTDYPHSADTLAAVLTETRSRDEVDPERIALWCFSGGGVLAADWLRGTPSWLRAIAWTYPVLAAPPDWPGDRERFDCVEAVRRAPGLSKTMVRVGAEYPSFVTTQDAFVAAAEGLEVIDLPRAAHGFEAHGYDEAPRAGVERALARVGDALAAVTRR